MRVVERLPASLYWGTVSVAARSDEAPLRGTACDAEEHDLRGRRIASERMLSTP